MSPEHKNFLWQCVRQRHLLDGLRFLVSPLRERLYQMRRGKLRVRVAVQLNPCFAAGSGPVLLPAVGKSGPRRTAVEQLLYDVDQQIQGNFRLAGAGYHKVDLAHPIWLGLDDPEDRHSFHRLYWAARYARARAHGHTGCGVALRNELQYWLDHQNEFGKEAKAAYTVAERIASLAEVAFWLKRESDTAMLSLLQEQVARDAQYLARNVEHGLGVHNHLLNDARGLSAAARLAGDSPESSALRVFAFELWDRYFPALLLPDGALREQSSHYHLLLCRTALEYWLASQEAQHSLPQGLEQKLLAMFDLANELVRSDGSMPRFGDNSPDRIVEDLWGLLAAAHACGLLETTPRHCAVTPLTNYYIAVEPPPAAVEPCENLTRLYAASGFAFLRRDGDQVELAIHADPSSTARAHGDAGRGSYELWWRGTVLIREPGCFLKPGDARSDWYREAAAQNVTSVSNLAAMVSSEDQRRMPEWYWNRPDTLRELPDGSVLWSSNAFKRLRSSLTLSRNWSFTPEGQLVVEEQWDGTGTIQMTSRLLLGDVDWAPLVEDEGVWTLRSIGLPQGDCILTIRPPEEATVRLELSSYTPEYGAEHGALALVVEGSVLLPLVWAVRCEFRARSEAEPGSDPFESPKAKSCAA